MVNRETPDMNNPKPNRDSIFAISSRKTASAEDVYKLIDAIRWYFMCLDYTPSTLSIVRRIDVEYAKWLMRRPNLDIHNHIEQIRNSTPKPSRKDK